MINKVLITGISGLLGNNLAFRLKNKYNVLGLFNTHPVIIKGIRTAKLNLLDTPSVIQVISEFDPSIIIHCASLANVDECEKAPELTYKINVQGTKNIVEGIRNKDVLLVYISSDSVYNGIKGGHVETDTIDPLNMYGRSKFQGEEETLKIKSLILRTNFFGWNIREKKGLAEWILAELEAGRQIRGFDDAFFSSMYTFELARIIAMAAQQQLTGVFNCGSSDSCSKYEFARKIAERFGFQKDLIQATSVDDFPFIAKRGKNLTLNVQKLQAALSYKLPTIDQSIDEFYKDYRCGLPEEIKQDAVEGRKASLFIPYGRQKIDENDIQAVTDVLHSDRITQGPVIEKFESELAKYCQAKYAVTVNSGTSALHIACLAAGVGPGDEVITTPISFVASANCVIYCGGRPVFADIDPKTYNIDPDEIRNKITKKTKAIVPVHLAGQSCNMEAIHRLSKEKENGFHHKIYVIEDASHALGSDYKSTKVGSCAFSDMAVLSFHPVKHITTGEGGAVLTNDDHLYRRLQLFRSHGITHNPAEFRYPDRAFEPPTTSVPSSTNPWYYEQCELGFNYRLTDIQSALGLSQLKKLPGVIKRRREIVEMYHRAFRPIAGLQTPYESEHGQINFHLYILLFDFERLGLTRALLMAELKKENIQTQVHYIPVHTQPYYQDHFGTTWGDFPLAESYYRKCLSIPLYPAMTDQDVNRVIQAIQKACDSSGC